MPVIEFRNVDRPAGRQRELVVFQRGLRAVGRRLRERRRRDRGIAVVPQRRPSELIGARFGGGADHAAAGGSVFRRDRPWSAR